VGLLKGMQTAKNSQKTGALSYYCMHLKIIAGFKV
jgi:hypothetical protein